MDSDECPDCEQGTVAHYRVEATGEVVQVCDGCDALWEADDELSSPSVSTVEHYLNLRGLPLLRTGLVLLV